MPKLKDMCGAAWGWLDERLGVGPLVDHLKHKTVPEHKHSFWYYWGGICLFFFMVQVLSGLMLMVYYRPGPEAYDSVRRITTEVQFGWLVRSIHSWSANLMIFAVMVHMFSVFFMKAYRRPREFGWWTGLGLLGLCMVFGFSGYLLPMDELAFFATRVGLSVPEIMPGAKPIITALVRGGGDVGPHTVQRFYVLHVMLLPAIFSLLIGAHLWLVQKHGNAVPQSEADRPEAERRSVPFFPNFMLRDAAVWLFLLNLLALLAAFFPWQLGKPADPLAAAPAGIHPEWYFMSQFVVLKILGNWLPGVLGEYAGVGLFTAGMVLWGLIPLFDPETASGKRARQITYLGLFVLVAQIVLTVLAYRLA